MSSDLLRIRRKRRLAAALRWAVAREPGAAPAALAVLDGRLAAIARHQQLAIPADADRAERLARIEPGGVAPPEVVAMLAALLHPLLSLRERSTER